MGLYLRISVNGGCVTTLPQHLLLYTPPSPLPPTLLFYSSLYPLCLPFLIFVSFYIPEQIEVENKKKRKDRRRTNKRMKTRE